MRYSPDWLTRVVSRAEGETDKSLERSFQLFDQHKVILYPKFNNEVHHLEKRYSKWLWEKNVRNSIWEKEKDLRFLKLRENL